MTVVGSDQGGDGLVESGTDLGTVEGGVVESGRESGIVDCGFALAESGTGEIFFCETEIGLGSGCLVSVVFTLAGSAFWFSPSLAPLESTFVCFSLLCVSECGMTAFSS